MAAASRSKYQYIVQLNDKVVTCKCDVLLLNVRGCTHFISQSVNVEGTVVGVHRTYFSKWQKRHILSG